MKKIAGEKGKNIGNVERREIKERSEVIMF